MSFYVTTDASCDLDKSLYREKFLVIPMCYAINGEEYGIDKNIDIREFYKMMDDGAMPTTALINSYFAKEQLSPILAAGNDILHICFSSGLSGSYDNLVIAIKELREEFPDRKIFLIDSLSASMGVGLLALEALDMRDNGNTIEDTYNAITALTQRMCHYFTVNNLFHLQRGGRVSRTTAIVGTMLNIKPLMYCNIKGKLAPYDKIVSRKKALNAVVDKLADHIDKNHLNRVAIVHGNCLEDAEFVAKKIKEKCPAIQNIIIEFVGALIASHTGSGVIAIMYVGDTRIEPKDETLR